MRMRELEKQTGIGRETIRFYIREGLLPEPSRTSRNSASYSDDHVTRLRAIKRLQEERFLPLAVIRSLLDDEGGDRWLEPQAFPQLDALLRARLDTDSARVRRAEVMSQTGLDDIQIDRMVTEATIAIDAAGTMSARDAAIARCLGQLNAIGFTDESLPRCHRLAGDPRNAAVFRSDRRAGRRSDGDRHGRTRCVGRQRNAQSHAYAGNSAAARSAPPHRQR
jgi:DNA-binding transcriptional MerR regulator